MRILAIDCCFGAVSAAVRWRLPTGQWAQREASEVRESGNAERLYPMISEVLAQAGVSIADIDRFAVTLGPGTFTGVRVGIATARALALATGKPAVGASSLEVMALGARQGLGEYDHSGGFAVAADARRGMVYFQFFDSIGEPVTQPRLLTIAEAARSCAAGGDEMRQRIVGSGAQAVADLLRAMGHEATGMFPELQPHAGWLAKVSPGLKPLTRVVPIYLRQPDVKEQPAFSVRAG